MGFSFVLQQLTGATALQSFAAGAALCSTSLGTTFTVLGSSGLIKSRLGVVLTSAAMMDDVVGLVMVQIISNLGASSSSVSAVTVIRPLLVSVAFGICAPLICLFVSRPLTLWLNNHRTKRLLGTVNRVFTKSSTAWAFHTSILVGYIAASSYAGTSNLFAAYIAGASISWWDTEVPHPALDGDVPHERPGSLQTVNEKGHETEATTSPAQGDGNQSTSQPKPTPSSTVGLSGPDIYEHYYMQPLDKVLRPFFFVGCIDCDTPFDTKLTSAGVGRILNPHHRNVSRLSRLEGHRLHYFDAHWQAAMRPLARPYLHAPFSDTSSLSIKVVSAWSGTLRWRNAREIHQARPIATNIIRNDPFTAQ